jgi:hypothetical protein
LINNPLSSKWRDSTGEGELMKKESIAVEEEEGALSGKQREAKDKPKDDPKLDSKIMIFNTKEK